MSDSLVSVILCVAVTDCGDKQLTFKKVDGGVTDIHFCEPCHFVMEGTLILPHSTQPVDGERLRSYVQPTLIAIQEAVERAMGNGTFLPPSTRDKR